MGIFNWFWKAAQAILDTPETNSDVLAASPANEAEAWWIRIRTENPQYTYYFGPFEDQVTAIAKRPGFVQDLTGEGATIFDTDTLLCNPSQITVEGLQELVSPQQLSVR